MQSLRKGRYLARLARTSDDLRAAQRLRWLCFVGQRQGADDPSALDAGGKVVFGATVELEDEDSGDKVTYQIVGEDEADLKHGLINISSPIARALIGKEEGDTAEVQAPGGVKHYEVIGVKYI